MTTRRARDAMTGTADGKALLAEGLKMIEERLAEEKSTNQRGG